MASANIAMDRTVLLASADASLRQRLRNSLSGLRWDVREARGGAETIAQLEGRPTEALLLDHWLPDLEVMELAEQIGVLYPEMELLRIDGDPIAGGTRSPRRHELLHAVRESIGGSRREGLIAEAIPSTPQGLGITRMRAPAEVKASGPALPLRVLAGAKREEIEPVRRYNATLAAVRSAVRIDELVGESSIMQELARTIRLVAPRTATVLIEGETGTGK
jgi:DNA-binding NtrC family response regulator